jgi:hypothetical protein
MSAVSTESPDTLVSKPEYKIPEKSQAIYTTDDEDDHQSFAEYSDTDEDGSESDEEIEFHEVTEPLYNPNMQNYEDEHGFTVNVRTDDEYSDDTTDSEYIEEKRRQSQMITPEAAIQLANQKSDSEGKYEDKIGAVYDSDASRANSDPTGQEHLGRNKSIENVQHTNSNHSDSEIDENTMATKAYATTTNNSNPFTIRPRSQKVAPLGSLQSTDTSDSENESKDQGSSNETSKSNVRSSESIRPKSQRPAARESFQSTEASGSENEQSDKIAPMVSAEQPKSSIRHSTSMRRSSKRIITPIDAQLVHELSSYLEPKKRDSKNSVEGFTDNTSEVTKSMVGTEETDFKKTPINKRQSLSSTHSNNEETEQEFDLTGYGIDNNDDEGNYSNHTHKSTYSSDGPAVHEEDDDVHNMSVAGRTETSSSNSVEGIHSASIYDFESDASADTALTTPKAEVEPLDDVNKARLSFTQQDLVDEPVQMTSPKDYVDYLEEMEQAPELPSKDSMLKTPTPSISNRFSIQSLSEMKEISLDQNPQPEPPIKDIPSNSQDNRFSLASYNVSMRQSKTLPPIDTSMGMGRQSVSSEHSSPRSGILQNAFRLQTPVTFSNPFKRSPPSSTVTTPRTSISTVQTRPSQAYSARQSKRMSKQLGLASPVTGGSVDEMLLARLEQQNSELRKDPKNRVLQNLQREAVRRSVENLKHDKANKGIDGEGEYDWGRL